MLKNYVLVFLLLLCVPLTPLRAYEVESLALKGKAQALMIEDHALPMVTVKLLFKGLGGVTDPAGKDGRASLASALLSEGAGPYDGQTLKTLLESKAIDIGFSVDEDNFSVSIRTLSENLPEALRLTGLMLTKPHFDAAALERVREQSLAEIRQRLQRPGYLAALAWDKAAYGEHPYATPTEGTMESLKNLTPQDMRSWLNQLGRNHLIAAIVGDVKAPQAEKWLVEHLSVLPARTELPIIPETPDFPLGKEPILVVADVPQTVVMFGMPMLSREDPDFYAAYLLNYILGGGDLVSRLSVAIREQRGLAYSAGTGLSLMSKSNSLVGNFATRNDAAVEAIEVSQNVLETMRKQGVTQAELDNAINYITGSFALELDTQGARAGYLITMQLYDLGTDYLDKRNEYFKTVSLKQINRVAGSLLSSQPLLVMAGKPQGKIDWHDTLLPKH
jgi:zinc protease